MVAHTAHSLPAFQQHVVTYPVSHGSFINLVGYDNYPGRAGTQYDGKWSQEVPKEEMVNVYKGWEHKLHQLFEVGQYLVTSTSANSSSAWIPPRAGC